MQAGSTDPGGRVEAGVQDRAVALGGTVEHVGRLFEHRHTRAFKREPARKGAADHTRADDHHVEHAIGHGTGGDRSMRKTWHDLPDPSISTLNFDVTGSKMRNFC